MAVDNMAVDNMAVDIMKTAFCLPSGVNGAFTGI